MKTNIVRYMYIVQPGLRIRITCGYIQIHFEPPVRASTASFGAFTSPKFGKLDLENAIQIQLPKLMLIRIPNPTVQYAQRSPITKQGFFPDTDPVETGRAEWCYGST
jgi:hypothetical protein